MQVYYPWLYVCFRHVTMRLADCVWCKPTFENCKSYCILWQHFPKVRSWLITAKLMGSASQCKRIWHVWHRCKSCISGLTRCWHYLPSWTKMSFADMQAEDEMVFNELGLKWQVTGITSTTRWLHTQSGAKIMGESCLPIWKTNNLWE